jgi:phosphoglycerate-specific signal transduction histidine kinase
MAFLRQSIDEYEKQILNQIENIQIDERQKIEEYKTIIETQFNHFYSQRNVLSYLCSVNDQIKLIKNKSQFFSYVNQTTEILYRLQTPVLTDYYVSGGLDQLQTLKQQITQDIRVIQTLKQILPAYSDGKPQLMEQCETNRDVNLNDQSLTDDDVHIIVQKLKNNTVIIYFSFIFQSLVLKLNYFFILISQTMVTLNLSSNQITSEGIRDLIDILRFNEVLLLSIFIRYIYSFISYRL